MFRNIGAMELLIILGIGVLLFGNRLPQLAKSMGSGIKNFKRAVKETEDNISSEPDQKERAKLEASAVPPVQLESREGQSDATSRKG